MRSPIGPPASLHSATPDALWRARGRSMRLTGRRAVHPRRSTHLQCAPHIWASQLLVESDFGFEPAEMLLLVCEDLLDKISRGGIMSRCGGLGGCIELRTSMALQSHVVVENLAHGCTDGERLDR